MNKGLGKNYVFAKISIKHTRIIKFNRGNVLHIIALYRIE